MQEHGLAKAEWSVLFKVCAGVCLYGAEGQKTRGEVSIYVQTR